MHGIELTPTQRQIADRRRQFHASIAAHARSLARSKATKWETVVEAALRDPPAPSTRFWFSIEDGPKHTIRSVQDAVCKKFNIDRTRLLQRRRLKGVVLPRQIAMYLCREVTTHSLPEIGRRFGGFDHTSVMSSVRKIENLIKTDPDMANVIRELREPFDGHSNPSCLPADQAPGTPASDCSPALTSGAGEAEEHPADGIGAAA